MKIQRIVRGAIKTFELTPKEIGQAHNEYVVNLFKHMLVNDFDFNNEMAEKYAEAACNGEKKEEWEQKTRELLQDFLKDFCSKDSSKEAEREE